MPRIEAASWVSQGLIASSRALLEFCPAASPRVRQSRLRRAPARPNAHSRPPRSAVSCPGRAVTARTETARGSESSADARAVLGRGVAVVIVIVLSCRVGHLVAGRLLFAGPAISTLAETREAAVHRLWRSGGSCLDVVADVADEIGAHLAEREPPSAVAALEPVAVATGGDRLEREVADLLEDGEVGARRDGPGLLLGLDDQVGGHVPGAGSAVGIGPQHGPRQFLDVGLAVRSGLAQAEVGVVEQLAESGEVAVVDEERVAGDEVLDGTLGAGHGHSLFVSGCRVPRTGARGSLAGRGALRNQRYPRDER